MNRRATASPWCTLTCLGLAWPASGIGFNLLVLDYVPTGLCLLVLLSGLFLVGVMSGAMLLGMLGYLRSALGRGWVTVGYAMFSPVALMGSLLVPSALESGSGPSGALALEAFLVMVVMASAAVGLGLALTGTLVTMAHAVAVRIHASATERRP